MPVTNEHLAALFQQMADIQQILGEDVFRVNSNARVARSLADLTIEVASVGSDVRRLSELPGIGKHSAQRIAEYLTTGHIADLDHLQAQIPPGLLELLTIPGLGPKKVALLWKHAGITCLADLKAKAAGEELCELPGMGKKSVENLRKNLAFAEASGSRMRLGDALPLALTLAEQLRTQPGVIRVEYAGSVRRGRETVGDIDLLAAAPAASASSLFEFFQKLPGVTAVLAAGETKCSVRMLDRVQVDLRLVEPKQFGAALLYFTGSKEHNVRLRERAIRQGLRLNEYALTRSDTQDIVASETEHDIYRALGLDWIPPELREDRGELDLAASHKLPRLIEPRDILAELHSHTTASDGVWTIEQIAETCIARGYKMLAITDHSRSQFQARGLDAARLEQHIRDIRKVAERYKGELMLLAGSEVDILSDGSLDYPDSLLAELDIVVASPHAALSQEPAAATDRLLRAIDNPYVTILGHPTGRLVGRREGLSPDMGKIIAAAKQRGIALEINANSHRLDLRDQHARAALESGVKLAIDTDAHGPADLDQLLFGILTARRAGATAADVINCMQPEALKQWIRSTRP